MTLSGDIAGLNGRVHRRLVAPSEWTGVADAIEAEVADGSALLLLTDYDGTLAPIVRDPDMACLSDAVLEDLRALAACGSVRLGIVSGRGLPDLRARVAIPGVLYAGCHGLEIDGPGISFRHPEATARRPLLESVASDLRVATAALAGVFVEDKGLALAVHYRQAAPTDVARLDGLLAPVLRNRQDLRALHGRKVVEVLPTPDWDKGHCVLRVRQHVLASSAGPVAMVYLGDDVMDELAFLALHGQALTVKVGGTAPTHATSRVRGIEDVHALFQALAGRVRREAQA